MNLIQSSLLKLVSAALKCEKTSISEYESEEYFSIDELMSEAKNQTVLPLIISSGNLSDKISSHYNKENRNQIGLNMRVIGEHGELHRMMTEAGIPYVIMKGASVAMLYPEPTLRTMGDVDFLVARSDFARADRVFKEHGFIEKVDKENFCHVSYRRESKSSVTFEMHWEPNGIPCNDIGDKLRSEIPDILKFAEIKSIGDEKFCVPSKYYSGLVLLLHSAVHMINSGIGLRQLCDWAVFSEQFDDSEFCDVFEKRLRDVGLWHFACILTELTVKYLDCSEKPSCTEEVGDLQLDDIIDDIFEGGNLGMKDPQRLNQAKLLTNRAKGTVNDDSAVKQLFMTLNEKARVAMPVCNKCCLLLPIGWVFVVGRHFFRIVVGKRNSIDTVEIMAGANRRRDLYKKMNLFEV